MIEFFKKKNLTMIVVVSSALFLFLILNFFYKKKSFLTLRSTKRDAFARKHFLRMCGCGSEIIQICLSFHLAHAKYNTLLSGEANAYMHINRIDRSIVCS